MIRPRVNEEIWRLYPAYRAFSVYVTASEIEDASFVESALKSACHVAINGGPVWANAHLEEWAEAYRSFGAKPKKTPCSAEALRKRVLKDGEMGLIDTIVDIYNTISIKYALPVGGEDADAYEGSPFLTIADGTETFDTMKEGQAVEERPDKGEVVWRDNRGVTCRRWNWRQGLRTRLSPTSKNMWFVLESLSSMPEAAFEEAKVEFERMIKRLMPGASVRSERVG